MNKKIPYSYRTFVRHYSSYANKHKATLRIRRKPREIMKVDWAGSTAFIIDRGTGEKVKTCVFVATLSPRYPWICLPGSWPIFMLLPISAGVRRSLLRIIWKPVSRDQSVSFRSGSSQHFETHSVSVLSNWMKKSKKVGWVQPTAFHQKARELFEEEKKFALSPLPPHSTKCLNGRWLKCGRIIKCLSRLYFIVPNEYINRHVEVCLTNNPVEIYFNNMRSASHKRLYGKTTPDTHNLYVD